MIAFETVKNAGRERECVLGEESDASVEASWERKGVWNRRPAVKRRAYWAPVFVGQ